MGIGIRKKGKFMPDLEDLEDDHDLYYDDEEEARAMNASDEDKKYINKRGRIDRPIIAKDLEDVREKIVEHISSPYGITYAIAVIQNDEHLVYTRKNVPCYGDLAKYRDPHGVFGEMNKYHPTDLYYPFPEGTPVMIGMAIHPKENDDFFQALFTEDSPWYEVTKGAEFVTNSKNHVIGLIFPDMNIDPTVWWNFLYRLRSLYAGSDCQKLMDQALAFGFSRREAIMISLNYRHPSHLGGGCWGIRRMLLQDPKRISGGTFAEGYGYTRPSNEHIFHDDGESEDKKILIRHLGLKKNSYGGYSNIAAVNDEYLAAIRKTIDEVMK